VIRWYKSKTVESRENLPQCGKAKWQAGLKFESLAIVRHLIKKYTSKEKENAGISLGHGASIRGQSFPKGLKRYSQEPPKGLFLT
jgi:hypothetical protein